MKIQNGAKIQDGRQNVLIVLNLCFFLFLYDCSSFTKKPFFLKIQNGRKIQYGRFFAQKFMIDHFFHLVFKFL
jgi:hypothetical protein